MIGKKINQLATELAPVSTDLTIIGDPISGVSKKITLAQLGAIFSGAVSFYTNLAGFPATGDINVIYCAKDTQKLYLWSGSAYVEVFPAQALLDTYQLRSEKGVSNGYASLDSSGKVPISQLPSSIMEYKGTWNAATNTPTLANGTGDTGDVYICNVAGTVNFGAGPITFAVGDYVIYSGSIWQRSSGAVGTVTSVAASITGNAIGITGSPVTTSGTLAFAFAGTGAQYIKGDGTLATFPSTIAQAERLITEVYNSTGATLTKGTIVYINGGQGNLPTVTKALATGDSTSAQTFGVVQADITNMNNGYVVVAGKLSDLDTQAYTPGTPLYLSSTTAGTWTSTKQYAPNHLVYIGIVVRAHPTQGIVEIKIQNGYELDELHNVAAQTPTNNDGLFWESATSLWKNKSIATVLGYTPQPQLSGTGFVKISGTTISYDNSTYLTTSAAASTYLPLVLNGSANTVDINGQQFTIQGSAGGFTSGRIIVDPVFSAIGYQNAGVFDGLKILTNGNAEFTNSGVTRFFNQVRFDSTLTNGTYTYTLPGATGTIALVGGAGVGTVTSVGLSSATSGVTIGSTPITTSGTITLAIATASGSQQGLLSSTDWTTFNNKQNALTNPVTGTGTTNYLPKFTGTSTIGNSSISDNGSGRVSIGTTSFTDSFVISASGTTGWEFGNAGTVITYNRSTAAYIPMTFEASNYILNRGNLGLGVTPSAWGSNVTALELPQSVSLYSWNANAVPQLYLGANHYWDGSTWRYKITGQASTLYYQAVGQHQWYTAPSGTAGNAISFTQAMTLDASGNLMVGTTTPVGRLTVQQSTDATNGGISIFSVNGEGAIISRLNDGGLTFRNGGSERFRIASTGAATFSSSVTANGLYANAGNSARFYRSANDYYWSIHNDSNNFLNFGTFAANGTAYGSNPKMILLDNGNVGIGTTSPTQGKLVVSGGVANSIATIAASISGGSNALNIGDDGTNAVLGVANSGTDMVFLKRVAGVYSEAMRITSGGNVGIGTTSPLAKLDVNGAALLNNIFVETRNSAATTNDYPRIFTSDGSAGGIRPAEFGHIFIQSRSTALRSIGFVTGTTPTERMTVAGDGAVGIGNNQPTSYGSGYANLWVGSSSNIGYLSVSNGSVNLELNADGNGVVRTRSNHNLIFGTNETERMRITSGGAVCINQTSSVGAESLEITSKISGSAQYGILVSGNPASYTNYAMRFVYTGVAVVGSITFNTTSTSYNTSSDYRLKTDYKDFSGLDLVSKIKAYDYEWKSDKSRSYGVIAHELQSVINYAVTGVKDGEQMQGVDYSKIVPVLIKAIQEQQQQIEQLKNK